MQLDAGIVIEKLTQEIATVTQRAVIAEAAKEILEAENVRLLEQVTKPQEGENGE